MTLTGQVRLFQNPESGQTVALIGGVELPTGSTGDKDLEGNSFETEFQPGSGSVDLQLGGAFSQPLGPANFDSIVLYIFANVGTQDIDLGDIAVSLQRRALVQRHWASPAGHDAPGPAAHDHGPTLDLILELNGEWSVKEEQNGVIDPDTGGQHTLCLAGSPRRWRRSSGLRVARHSGLQLLQRHPVGARLADRLGLFVEFALSPLGQGHAGRPDLLGGAQR